MDPSVSGPNGTMRASALAAGPTVSKFPEASATVATTDSGLLAFTITGPENDGRPKDAAVNRCWDPAAIFTKPSAGVLVFEVSNVISAVTTVEPRLPRINSDLV